VLVNGFHPFVEEAPLRLILLGVLALDFEDEEFARHKTNEKIRPVFAYDSSIDVENLKPKVVVLDPGRDVGPLQRHMRQMRQKRQVS